MNEQKNSNGGNSCVMTGLIVIVILFSLTLGAFGGIVAEREGRTSTVTYPSIPAPAPETLNYVPSVQTFAEPVFDPCADPAAPVAGWENGVGGELPACWPSWTREQQNAFLRSH